MHGGRLLAEPEYEHATASEAAASGALRQLEEGGWEWTGSAFEPLPGGPEGCTSSAGCRADTFLGITSAAPLPTHNCPRSVLTWPALAMCVFVQGLRLTRSTQSTRLTFLTVSTWCCAAAGCTRTPACGAGASAIGTSRCTHMCWQSSGW